MDPFRQLFDRGFVNLLPIVPPDAVISPRSTLAKRPEARGKTPGVLGSNGWHSFDWANHATIASDLVRWAAMGAGVGIRCGEMPDCTWIVLVDADTLHPQLAELIQAEVDRRFPGAPRRIGRAPKAGTVLRLSGPLRYCRVDFDDGVDPKRPPRVEILTEGKQFVASGIHPDTRQPYTWAVPLVPFDELPVRDPAEVTALLDALVAALPAAKPIATEGSTSKVDQAKLRGDAAMVRRAVAAIPNTSALFPTRESYLAVGYAVKAAVADEFEARDIWGEWCGRWVDGANDPERDDAEWRRMKAPFRRGASWLYELAEQHGDGAFGRADLWFEAPVPEVEPLFGVGDGAGVPPLPEPVDLFGTADPATLSEPPAGSLPAIVERWATSEARRKGVSIAFASAAAVGVLGAAIGSSLLIRPTLHDDGWKEPAALWIALLAGPGHGKSPIISAATQPLRALDRERFAIDNEAHKRWAAAEAAHRRKRDPGPPPGPEPVIRRSVVDDATLEKQVRIHADNPRGLLRATDELISLLGSLGAYKKHADGDRSQMLRMFDGDQVIVDRVGPGTIYAERALMGVLAGTQPDKIRALVKDLGQDGMLQRFVFLLDDGIVREGIDEAPDVEARRAFEAMVRRLGSEDHGRASSVVLQSPEARAVLAEALARMRRLRHLPGTSDAWIGHVQKWPKILSRLALVFHAVRHFEIAGGVLEGVSLDVETARQATAYGWFLLGHSLRFYETYFGQSVAMGHARSVAGHLLTRPDIATPTRRDVYEGHRALRGDENLQALLAAMRELENCGWIHALERDRDGPRRWQVDPRIHQRFAEHAERERRERAAAREHITAARQVRDEELG